MAIHLRYKLFLLAATATMLMAIPTNALAFPSPCKEKSADTKTVFFYGDKEFLLKKCWELTPVNGTFQLKKTMPQDITPVGYRVYQYGEQVHGVEGVVQNGQLRLSNGAHLKIEDHEPIYSVMKRVKTLYKWLYLKNSFQV